MASVFSDVISVPESRVASPRLNRNSVSTVTSIIAPTINAVPLTINLPAASTSEIELREVPTKEDSGIGLDKEMAKEALGMEMEKGLSRVSLSDTKIPVDLELALPPAPPPKPTLHGWLTVCGVFLIQLAVMGLVSSFGVFQDYYAQTFMPNVTPSNISWIGTVPLFLGFGCGLVGGRIYDRGWFKASMCAGAFIFIICFFLLSLAKEHNFYQVFLPQGLGTGFALMLIYTPSFSAVAVQFRQQRALAMGIIASASPLGGIIYSVMINNLFRSVGFGWAVRIAAFVALACLVVGLGILLALPNRLFVRPPLPPGTLPPVQLPLHKLIDLPYYLVLISGFCLGIGTYYPLFYIELFAINHGVNANLAFYSVAIMNAACILGRIVPNWLGDKFGAIEVAIPSIFLNGAVCFAMLKASNVPGAVLFSSFYGFFLGASISLYLPVVYAVTPKGLDLGRSMGVGLGPVGLGFLIGSPIISVAQSLTPTTYVWWKGTTIASTFLIGAAAFMAAAVWVHSRRMKRAQLQAKTII